MKITECLYRRHPLVSQVHLTNTGHILGLCGFARSKHGQLGQKSLLFVACLEAPLEQRRSTKLSPPGCDRCDFPGDPKKEWKEAA